jgi:beta-galactosidase
LKAVGYVGRKKVNTSVLRSADAPSVIKLTPDRLSLKNDGQSLSYITVELTDAKGNINPKAANTLTFEISGAGEILAVANANPMSTESFQKNQRKAWRGKCLVIVKSERGKGQIRVKVTSEGMAPAEVTLELTE